MLTRIVRHVSSLTATFFRAGSIAGLGIALLAGPATAAAPFAKFQAPGFFRTTLGQFEVTALSDGAVNLDVVKLLSEPAAETEAALKASFLQNPLPTSVNAFVINTGRKLILVDAGGGTFFGPSLGKLQSNLRAAGYSPEQVDDVLVTHMHRDHIGGLVLNGALAFPNATIHADKRETEFWLSKENLDKAPEAIKPRFLGAVAMLKPYIDAGRYQPFATNTEILPGIRSMESYGHSAGHTTYVVESGGQALWLIGDLIGVGSVQLQHPRVAIGFDGDADIAADTREHLLRTAAQQGFLIGAAHLPFPGLGHIRKAGTTWNWLPIDSSLSAN
jgi:glyoxylase-like metal-dependent hydrolase (beta-lactamase superfamily II)